MAYWGSVQPVVKKLALAMNAENYNVLQNNGRLAHQEVDHVGLLSCRCECLLFRLR